MRTEDWLILGVGAFLAYRMIKKDVGEAIDTITPDIPSMPTIDFSNFWGNFAFPAMTFPEITFTPTITAGTPFASPQTPATSQPSMFNPGSPDPYTKAPPEILTGMPKGAQFANVWGEGYGYDWKTQPDLTPLSTAKTGTLVKPPSVVDLVTMASPKFVFGSVKVASSPIKYETAKTSDAGTQVYQRTPEQQAYIDARSHLGTPIGTAAPQAKYTPAYIASLPKSKEEAGGGPYQTSMGYNIGTASAEYRAHNPSF